MFSIEANEIHRGKGLDCIPVISRSLEHHAGGITFQLFSTSILREKTLKVVSGLPHSSPSTSLTRELVARQLFRLPPCCEGTIHSQTSIPSPGFEPRHSSQRR
ncbi:hypothetical protein TNCV_4755571 [Trichonephila clavipes]|nr:hypothetical protein TNCV_4755571 [Trichonephila clavipes]